MYYSKGDTPAAPILVLPTRDGDPVDLELYTTATAQLVQPDGTITPATSATILPSDDPDAPAIEVQLPALQQAGLVQVKLRLTGATGQDTFDVEPVVVEDLDGWHTLGSARGEWAGAKSIEDARLYVLLSNARRDCLTYGPRRLHADDFWPLVSDREAQLVQARNRNVASRIDPAGASDGVDGYGATVYPLDWVVKALLRPARRFGAIR